MRKQVLILGHNYATQFIDIYNQYTLSFDPEKYDVTVAFLTGPTDEAARARTLAKNVLFLDIPKKTLRGLKISAIKRLYDLTKEKKFDVVVCHRYKPTYIMLWVNLFIKIPAMIFVMHELRTMTAFGRQCLIKLLYRKHNMLFAGVSNAVRDDLREYLWPVPNDQIVTLYNMMDTDGVEKSFYSREEAREKLDLPQDAFVYGNVARLAKNKDQANLIHAFSLIQPYCEDTKLILIGDGQLEADLKKQVAEYHLEDKVIFAGFVPEGYRYMKAFDCFVLTSIQEAFGRVLTEAMLANIPVIATRVNGIPEVMGDTGKLINPKDAAQLEQALKEVYLASQTEREKIANAGYQRVIDDFSIAAFKKQLWQLPVLETIGA